MNRTEQVSVETLLTVWQLADDAAKKRVCNCEECQREGWATICMKCRYENASKELHEVLTRTKKVSA